MRDPRPALGGVSVRVPAKINLHLGVGPTRPDGFHPLATAYQAISLTSTVNVRPAAEWSVTCQGAPGISVSDVPLDDSNLALRAARLLAERNGIDTPVTIHLDKGIPVAGGLAGGSADAAAALLACAHLWALPASRYDGPSPVAPELLEIAAELGSDVPFGLVGGTASGSGRGELVEPLEDSGTYHWVVLAAEEGISTPAVYREFDALHDGLPIPDPTIPAELVTALAAGSAESLARTLGNDLQQASLALRPELADVLQAGLDATALAALVSGSGPSCLFLCRDADHALDVAAALSAYGTALVAHGPVPGAERVV